MVPEEMHSKILKEVTTIYYSEVGLMLGCKLRTKK